MQAGSTWHPWRRTDGGTLLWTGNVLINTFHSNTLSLSLLINGFVLCDLWHLIYKAWTCLPPFAGRCWSCNGCRLITMLINLHLPDFVRCTFQFACHYACIWFSLILFSFFWEKRTHTSYFRQITSIYSYALEMCISEIITATFSIWIIFKHTYSM